MFQRVGVALGMLLILSGGASAQDTFDLVCTTASAKDEEASSERFAVDLSKMELCEENCISLHRLLRADKDRIEFQCNNGAKSDMCGISAALDVASIERRSWSLSRKDGRFLSKSFLSGGWVGNGWKLETGKCTQQPFSGFNGEYLYPEMGDSPSDKVLAARLPQAFTKNVVLRLITESKFVPPLAVWLSQEDGRYSVSSIEDTVCERKIDSNLAAKIKAAWVTMLRRTDSGPSQNKGNRTIFHFSMGNDFAVPAGWSKDPNGGAGERARALISIAGAMKEYCQSGKSDDLAEAIDGLKGALKFCNPLLVHSRWPPRSQTKRTTCPGS